MTNGAIIKDAAVAAGLWSEEEAVAIIMRLGSLPLHTFKEWQRMGWQVRKGEKAALTCNIWKPRMRKSTEKDGEEEHDGDFYMTKAFFFTFAQVDKIQKGE